MSDEFGPLANIVSLGGCLIAAAGAFGLAWMRGAKWQPPEKDLPGATAKFAALLCAVAVAILYVIGPTEMGRRGLAWVAVFSVMTAVAAFLVCRSVNVRYAYTDGRITDPKRDNRILGGYALSDEAKSVKKKKEMKNATTQRLLELAGYEPDLIWTRASRDTVQTISTVAYLLLQAFGSIGLAAAAILMSLAPSSS
jgi:hypothetical protein